MTKILKEDFSQKKPKVEGTRVGDELAKTHEQLTPEHLSVIEAGGEDGLERLMGAVIVTGEESFKITCAEIYCRRLSIDPHAELLDAVPSSVPTDELSTQERNRLKIVKMNDIGKNKELVIGVRAHNYLVSSGHYNGNARVGPGRCADGFKVNGKSKLFIRKERQDGH
ncbi:hypothetical protein BGZ49_004316, partial [Haplosporangium sp. Z 27]